ncbi:hypothetical protein [Sphingomonas sp. OK281]|uniref:hypothetical protein n=1 Tax=Sphingomonas sp. OK281 TaxID=1881067 RepID=UPI0008EA61CA|nr:hypothetical protein [Sphingomonas sp. OK281]SFO26096.1 hypothetical protein SAMN05428984_3024 [Sphingomonas sp. OK281]
MKTLMLFGAVALAGCATPQVSRDAIGPMVAIERAAGLAPGGYPGIFVMTVRASGTQGSSLYLNSERDYRDPRNLSLEVRPIAQAQLEARLGAPAGTALQGRTIRVDGEARRVRIDFTTDGRPTGKYYYQTHVVIARGEQLLSVD